MGAKRIVWHVGFGRNLRRRGSKSFEVLEEILLSSEALRMDYLLLRKVQTTNEDQAQTLRKLWPLLPTLSIVEYKSPGRPYRRGDLDRLWGYVHVFMADEKVDISYRADLCTVLAIPHRTPSFDADIVNMGLVLKSLGDGYHRMLGGLFSMFVVELDVAGRAEHDDLLYALGSGKITTLETRRFFAELIGSKEAGMSVQDMEGLDEVTREMLEIVMMLPHDKIAEKLSVNERLAGLAPEQRLADLDRDHQALALPIELLRQLSNDYLRTLSPQVQDELRRRLGH